MPPPGPASKPPSLRTLLSPVASLQTIAPPTQEPVPSRHRSPSGPSHALPTRESPPPSRLDGSQSLSRLSHSSCAPGWTAALVSLQSVPPQAASGYPSLSASTQPPVQPLVL